VEKTHSDAFVLLALVPVVDFLLTKIGYGAVRTLDPKLALLRDSIASPHRTNATRTANENETLDCSSLPHFVLAGDDFSDLALRQASVTWTLLRQHNEIPSLNRMIRFHSLLRFGLRGHGTHLFGVLLQSDRQTVR
jgi:hypothetical protein